VFEIALKDIILPGHIREILNQVVPPSPTFAFLNGKRTSCEAPVAVEYAVTLLF
jgi:hypothetical protein